MSQLPCAVVYPSKREIHASTTNANVLIDSLGSRNSTPLMSFRWDKVIYPDEQNESDGRKRLLTSQDSTQGITMQ